MPIPPAAINGSLIMEEPKQIFQEVISDYTDSFTGERAIDAYRGSEDDDEDGVVVAWVRPDGTFRLGDHSKPEYLFCPLVQETLRDAIVEIVTRKEHEKEPS
jgi:hypothetical protein